MVNISQSVRSSKMRRARNNSMGLRETPNLYEGPMLRDSATGLNLANPDLNLKEETEVEDNKSRMQRSENITPFTLHKNASLASLDSHLTLNQ